MMIPLNTDWLEPVDAAKWPMYSDCGYCVMCYSTTVRLCILPLISF